VTTAPSPLALLDGDWYFLGAQTQGCRRIALLSSGGGEPLGAVCTSRQAAHTLANGAGLEVLEIRQDDLRAKEEWLEDVLGQGAERLLIDPGEGERQVATEKALWYILSFKRQTACL